jgi:hypothetical protein
MFSLGCVLLEILILHETGSLSRLRQNRSTRNPAFHANLRQLDIWLPLQDRDTSPRRLQIVRETRALLNTDLRRRPRAAGLLSRLQLCDKMVKEGSPSIFGTCCQTRFMTVEAHDKEMAAARREIEKLEARLLAAEQSASTEQLWPKRERISPTLQQIEALYAKVAPSLRSRSPQRRA